MFFHLLPEAQGRLEVQGTISPLSRLLELVLRSPAENRGPLPVTLVKDCPSCFNIEQLDQEPGLFISDLLFSLCPPQIWIVRKAN